MSKRMKERSDALLADCIIACNLLQDAPEINPSNYDHDDVCRLNAAACEAYQVLLAAIKKANSVHHATSSLGTKPTSDNTGDKQ